MAPITYGEIESWIRVTGQRLHYHEIDWLVQMDNQWMDSIATERKARSDREKEKSNRN